MKDQDEMFEAATELPAVMGCPSLGPKKLPSGFDGVEPGEDEDFFKIGDAPIRYVASVRTTCIKCIVNGRKFCVEIFRVDPVGCEIFLYDNGEQKMSMKSMVGRKAMTYVAFAMLKSYVRHLDGRRFLKKAAKAAAKIIKEELT